MSKPIKPTFKPALDASCFVCQKSYDNYIYGTREGERENYYSKMDQYNKDLEEWEGLMEAIQSEVA